MPCLDKLLEALIISFRVFTYSVEGWINKYSIHFMLIKDHEVK